MSKIDRVENRGALIKRASLAGMVGNAILAVLKIVAGFISGSAAVIADGIDSASDIVSSLITFYANSVSVKPPDKKHPWGYQRIETIATKVIAILIIFAGIQLVIATAGRFFYGAPDDLPGVLAIVVTLISIVGKASISIYQFHIAKKTNSSMVKADATHMKNDIYLSSLVLIGLVATYLTNLPLIDTIIGAGLGLWIIGMGAKLSLQSNADLMDSFDNQEALYKQLFAVIAKRPQVHNPHKARIRKINNLYDISFDIEVDNDLTIVKAHAIAKELEQSIRKEFVDVYDVMIHLEPLANDEEEQFGLSPKDFEI